MSETELPSQEEPKLTSEAKDAIRSYMLKFAVPSGVFLTIVSGLGGYVVSGVARIDASSEAAKYALAAAGDAAKATANAAQAAREAAEAKDKALVASSNAEDTKKYLLSVKHQVDQILTGQYAGLAKSLFEIKDFRDSIQTIPQHEISDINAKFAQIEKVLYDASDAPIPLSSNAWCPPGTYLTSVGSVSASGGAHGYLESISLGCKPLRFNRPK